MLTSAVEVIQIKTTFEYFGAPTANIHVTVKVVTIATASSTVGNANVNSIWSLYSSV